MAALFPATAASPKRVGVYWSLSAIADATRRKRVGIHNGSFRCDVALGCFLICRTSQFDRADVVRTRDSQVFLARSSFANGSICLALLVIKVRTANRSSHIF
jgi:hypothetical protein